MTLLPITRMKKNHKLKIVIDTNVWISGLVFGGPPEYIVRLFAENTLSVVISEEIITELRRIVTTKFPKFMPKLALLELSLKQDAETVKLGGLTISVSRDPDDNKIIETAILGDCQYIVTGDHDLLVLKTYQGVKILKPTEFLNLIS